MILETDLAEIEVPKKRGRPKKVVEENEKIEVKTPKPRGRPKKI